jgi:hypothetical protein
MPCFYTNVAKAAFMASTVQSSASSGNPSARDQALMLLLQQAADAAANDPQRSDELISRVLAAEEGSTSRSPHDVRMDMLRFSVAFFMVLGLFGIVAIAIYHPTSTNASSYVSLMSGLAGIALGWLFGSGAVPVGKVAEAVTSRRQRRSARTGNS